ncbi:MAG: GNAT family N-acetyltransferase [Patescibacteria group bacterium]
MKFKIKNPRLDEGTKLTVFYEQQYQPKYILTNERFRRWWLHDNPNHNGKNYSIKVAESEGEFIGHCAYVPVNLWSGGHKYHAAWGGNFIVAEHWRGRGIGRALHQAIYDEFDVFLDVGANTAAEIILQKFGWINFGTLGRAMAVLSPAAAAFSRRPELISKQIIKPSILKSMSVIIEQTNRVGEDVEQFWQQLRMTIGNISDRSMKFLNWRYANHPIFRYQFLLAKQKSEVIGLVVYRDQIVKENGLKLRRIVEFLAREKGAEVLLQQLVKNAREERVVLIDFFCASIHFLAPFTAAGFILSPPADEFTRLFDPVDLTRLNFGTISFNGGNIHNRLPKEVFNLKENWYVTSGDGDQDRPNRILPTVV